MLLNSVKYSSRILTYLENIRIGLQVFAIAATDINKNAANFKLLYKLIDLWPWRVPRFAEMICYFVVHFVHILQFALRWIVYVTFGIILFGLLL